MVTLFFLVDISLRSSHLFLMFIINARIYTEGYSPFAACNLSKSKSNDAPHPQEVDV